MNKEFWRNVKKKAAKSLLGDSLAEAYYGHDRPTVTLIMDIHDADEAVVGQTQYVFDQNGNAAYCQRKTGQDWSKPADCTEQYEALKSYFDAVRKLDEI